MADNKNQQLVDDFSDIVEKSKPIVLTAIVKTLSVNYHDYIDDVAQETYLRAYKTLMKNGFSYQSSITTWLYAIARNEARRFNQKMAREEKKREKIEEHFFVEDKISSVTEIADINLLLAKIPEKHREILELVLGGMKNFEIAEALNIPDGTVKSRLNRAKASIKNLAREEFNE